MEQINYEAEVKKVYPDADWYNPLTGFIEIRNNKGKNLGSSHFKVTAWENAYKKLKSQGKIK